MIGIYGVHSFNTYTTLFTKERLNEKHLFNFEYGALLKPIKTGQR